MTLEGFSPLLLMVVYMALIDSIDPCFFILYASILASYSLRDLRSTGRVALSFILSVACGYWVFEFVLRSVLGTYSLPREYILVLLMAYGLAMVVYGVRESMKDKPVSHDVCRDDMVECGVSKRLGLERLAKAGGVAYVSLTGFIASFTLLPCSAGMYIVYAMLTSSEPLWVWIPYTLLYVAVFVSPLILITLAFIGLSRTVLYEKLLRHQNVLRIIGGITAMAIAVYIYLYR